MSKFKLTKVTNTINNMFSGFSRQTGEVLATPEKVQAKIDKVTEAIKVIPNVGLIGSRVIGTFSWTSDLDIVVMEDSVEPLILLLKDLGYTYLNVGIVSEYQGKLVRHIDIHRCEFNLIKVDVMIYDDIDKMNSAIVASEAMNTHFKMGLGNSYWNKDERVAKFHELYELFYNETLK